MITMHLERTFESRRHPNTLAQKASLFRRKPNSLEDSPPPPVFFGFATKKVLLLGVKGYLKLLRSPEKLRNKDAARLRAAPGSANVDSAIRLAESS